MANVAVDFDGVLADTNSVKSRWIKKNLGLDVPPFRCDRTICVPIIGKANYHEMGIEVYSKRVTLGLRPLSGCLGVIGKLLETGSVIVVSARTGERLDAAAGWLSQYEETKGLQIVRVDTRIGSKLQRCREGGFEVLIDDDERHVQESRRVGLCGILFKDNAPREFASDCAIVCRSWLEIGRALGLGKPEE